MWEEPPALSNAKENSLALLEQIVTDEYRRNEVDVSRDDVVQIATYLSSLGHTCNHMSEVYSPPRFSAEAQRFGLKPGFSIDLETQKANGEPWDLSKKGDQE